jgi:hypothetical protein
VVIWADASAAEAARRSAWTSMLIDFGMVKSASLVWLAGERVLCYLNDGVDVVANDGGKRLYLYFRKVGFVWCLMQERK